MALERGDKSKPRIMASTWALIYQDMSPEQVSERLKKKWGVHISHERIYQYILADKGVGGGLYLPLSTRAIVWGTGRRKPS